ncbi:MAG: CoA-binding protein [Bacteriovoracaceae bacterium]|nr:CoA-binding protein [Bacteriovoracaceae bacterium]
MNSENVVILGASDKVERYSYKAMKMLIEHGHKPILVHPKLKLINGIPVFHTLSEITNAETLTIYVNKEISNQIRNEILNLDIKRVIFNPGTENPELKKELEDKNIKVEEACTLVLLSTDQF